MAAAAADVAVIGSSLSEANGAAADATTDVIAAAGDEVSTAIATLFSNHGKAFQALSASALAAQSRFAQTLGGAAEAYANTEATSTASLPVPNIAISVSGFTVIQSGSATAYSFLGSTAIAVGANSFAQSDEGTLSFFNHAFAIGQNSTALAVWGSHDRAIALGANSEAIANGNFEVASAVGTGSYADTGQGPFSFSTAVGTNSMASTDYSYLSTSWALGAHSVAGVDNGTLNTALALGDHNTANAVNGNLDLAYVVGTGSTASAGGTTVYPSVPGSYDLAVAVGNGLDATATGANRLVHIAFQP
jgi:hypothetical protein